MIFYLRTLKRMSGENPQNIIRSWNSQANFANGRVLMDRLVPPAFSRIRTPFLHTWREDAASVANLDWGSKNFSIYLPESLRVVRAIFLKIECPAISANFKSYPGLAAVKSLRILSAGQEVYTADVERFLVDYCQSLSEEQLKRFAEAYLGHASPIGTGARTFLIPLLLPNSQYMQRNGQDTRGFGVFPCYLGQNRLELQLTLNDSDFTASDKTAAPASIAGSCTLMYHQVEMTPDNILKYSDLRGNYSIINRRFTELTNGYQIYSASDASGKVVARWTSSQPQGVVSEIQVIAVASDGSEDLSELSAHTMVKADLIRVIADSVTQRELDGKHKIDVELWTNGFCAPTDFPHPARMCFASHCGESSHAYTGGYNMTLASNVTFEVRFPVACRYKIIAVQYQRVTISALGQVQAFLD